MELFIFFLLGMITYFELMLRKLKFKRIYIVASSLPIISLFYVFYGLFVYKNNLHHTLFEYHPFVYYFSFIFPIFLLKNREDVNVFLKWFYYITALYLPFVLLQYYLAQLNIMILPGKYGEMQIIEETVRYGARTRPVLLFFSLFILWRMIKRMSLINIALFVGFVITILLSYSRNFFISLVLGALIIFWLENKAMFKKLPVMLTFFFVGALIIYFLLADTVLGSNILVRLQMISTDSLTSDRSLMYRVMETKHAWRVIAKAPFLGHGLGYSYFSSLLSANYYIHNSYLFLWMKMGIPGLISVASLFWLVGHLSMKLISNPNLQPHIKGFAIACFAYNISIIPSSIVNPMIVMDNASIILFSLLLGVLIKLNQISENDKQDNLHEL
ncbi:O-antigen ligase family protein [Nitrospirota bacterium]